MTATASPSVLRPVRVPRALVHDGQARRIDCDLDDVFGGAYGSRELFYEDIERLRASLGGGLLSSRASRRTGRRSNTTGNKVADFAPVPAELSGDFRLTTVDGA